MDPFGIFKWFEIGTTVVLRSFFELDNKVFLDYWRFWLRRFIFFVQPNVLYGTMLLQSCGNVKKVSDVSWKVGRREGSTVVEGESG